MARVSQIIDDLTGATLNEEVDPTVIEVDGTKYELDLGSSSKDRLVKWLSGEGSLIVTRSASTTKTKAAQSGPSAAEIRAWAKDNGHDVPEKGRIPQAVRDAWDAK